VCADGAERWDAEWHDHVDDGGADYTPDVGTRDTTEHRADPDVGGTDDPGAVGTADRGEAPGAADRAAAG
jgi:hypothetical protein